jgi:hypothetical protein
MASDYESHTTTDHETIKGWAEARGGHPAHVKSTGGKDDPGVLRISFDRSEDSLEGIGWDEFFAKFEESNLAFLYQEHTKHGDLSRFFKLVSRHA